MQLGSGALSRAELLTPRAPVRERASPNHGARRDGARPELIVLHYTAMENAEAALARLCDPAMEVSAHYLICERGDVWRLVDERRRAWHAGAGAWGAVRDVNSHSIGIELANAAGCDGLPPFAEPQMAALEALLDEVMARWAIPAARVLGHSDVAPGRKWDPGPKFDWARLARGGRAVRPAAPVDGAAPGWAAFLCAAGAVGYAVADTAPADVLAAFRLRFRPIGGCATPDAVDTGLALAASGQTRVVRR